MSFLKKCFKWGVILVALVCVAEVVSPTEVETGAVEKNVEIQESIERNDDDELSTSTETISKVIRGDADAPLESIDYLLYYVDTNDIKLHDFEYESAEVEKKVTKLMENDSNRHYIRMKNGVWERTYAESRYGYIGELKDGKPIGTGVIIDLALYYSYDMEFIYYIGEFNKGKFDGYGQIYNTPSEDLVSMYYGYATNEKLNSALNYLMYSGEFDDGELRGRGNYFIYTPDDNLLAYYNISPTEATVEALLEISDKNGVYGMFKDSIADYYKEVPFSFEKVDIPIDMFYKNIKIVVGEFKNNDLNGDVKVYCYGKLLYDGEMRSGLYDGVGTLYYHGSNQKYYQGEFDNGKITSEGDTYSLDGERL